jgi:hypothetical protein
MYYQPSNWYWTIGADTGNVWSSARAMLVPISDPGYVAWQGPDGRVPPNMATMADLEDTLRQVFPAGTPKTYAADLRYRKASGGVIISSLSPAAFYTDPVSRNTIDSAHNYAVANPGVTTQWKMSDGTFIQVDEAKLLTMVNTVAGFVQACFTCESNMVTGINGGSITTLAQIDAAFAAISNVYP